MSTKKNIIANYLGQGWRAIMEIAFVPLYVKYLGIEAFGLIGIFALLQAWLNLLDVGMTPTLSREMARFTGGAHNKKSIRDLLRSIEVVAITISVIIGTIIWNASDWLATDWLKTEELPIETVSQAFSIMGIIIALRFIENIYRSSIVGLQKQVTLNIITSIMATMKGVGSIGVLLWISNSIEAFFIWQVIVSIVTLGLFSYTVYNTLPEANYSGRFSLSALQSIWKYAGGMVILTFLGLLLTQTDKILLTKLLPLQNFGYYSFAAIVAAALFIFVTPISQAFFPHFSKLIARENETQLIQSYHTAAQMVTVILGSAAVFLIFFAEPLLLLWTQDLTLTKKTALLVVPLALGNLLNGLMFIPYQTQLAYGWTTLSIKISIIQVCMIIPAIFWLVPIYGAEAAAWIWVFLNSVYVLVGVHFMCRKILTGEKWKWYLQDVLLPLGVATIVAILFSMSTPEKTSVMYEIGWLFVSGACIFFSSLLASSILRIRLIVYIKKLIE